jgi:TolB-like protein
LFQSACHACAIGVPSLASCCKLARAGQEVTAYEPNSAVSVTRVGAWAGDSLALGEDWYFLSQEAAAVVAITLLAGLSSSRLRQRLFGRRSPQIHSLAVLPLVNLSSDKDQDYFTDGMTEELTTDLGRISALRVISRTSAMQYKGTKKPLPEIARELNVDALIEGTVTRSGNHLRITANLVQAFPEKHLWAESYESQVGDALTVQGEISQAVAREVKVQLTHNERSLLAAARPVNPEAQDRLFGMDSKKVAELREAIAKSGAQGYWKRTLENYKETARSNYAPSVLVAATCVRLNDKECALGWLEKGFEERDDLMINLKVEPVFDRLRMEPRYQELVRRVGIP